MAVKKRRKLLSNGRPPLTKAAEGMSSKQSRKIIRAHHRLQKEQAAATKKGDMETATAIGEAIEKNGGIEAYQAASIQGQAKVRGGDATKALVKWLKQAGLIPAPPDMKTVERPYKLLEIGCLSEKNDISGFPSIINVTRIDLNSQGPGIEQQDFMERPLPSSEDEYFDIISLSLVLNYVPDPEGRGEMLKRARDFLRRMDTYSEDKRKTLPALFLVLPVPCVTNSRYLNEGRLNLIFDRLGFRCTYKKQTAKLYYFLYTWDRRGGGPPIEKKLINEAKKRTKPQNNFCIVLK